MKQEARPGDGLESPGFSRGEEVNPGSDTRPPRTEIGPAAAPQEA